MPLRLSRSRLAASLGSLVVASLAAAPVVHATTRPGTTLQTSLSVVTSVLDVPVSLLGGDTGTLAQSPGAWTADNGRLALVSSGVLATTTTVSGWSVTRSGTATPARPGSVYTGRFDVRSAVTGRQVVPYLYFYDDAGNLVDKVKGDIGQDVPGAWSAVTQVVGIAPPTATAVALATLTWGSVVGETHYLRSPVLTVASPAPKSVVGPLRTVGNQVYDANGPVVLRGVNRVGLETSTTGNNLTDEDLGQAQRWGATMVRVPLASSFWLSSNCHYYPGYAAVVDSVVERITAYGMVALLDLHRNTTSSCGPVLQQPMADATAVDFWTSVAKRYGSNPLVAFDLYNEPHDISDAVWLNGGTVTTSAGPYQAVGMQKLYGTVRATGADNLVFVSGNGWASSVPSRLVNGSDIVYGVHAYTCPLAVDSTCAPNPTQPPPNLATWVPTAAQTPVVVTEFGWPSGGSGTYNTNVLAYLAAQGWGWTAFAWDGTVNGRFTLLSTAGPGASYQPSAAGMPILTALTAQGS
jgi:hypothetical protein